LLARLSIKNIALIDEIDVEFHERLNILTGETGAGKSMVIEALYFILGSRPPKDFIRRDAETASVSAIITVKNETNKKNLSEMGIETDEEDSLHISRTLNDAGKSVCRVNGKTVTSGMLKELAAFLFDTHSQHEHHSLLTVSRHIELLDIICGDEAAVLKNDLAGLIKNYNGFVSELNSLKKDEPERERTLDMLSYQIKEIESARLKKGEEEGLAARLRVLSNMNAIRELTFRALGDLYEGSEPSAIDRLADGKATVERLSTHDEACAPFTETLDSIYIQLDDFIRDFRRYAENISSDPNELTGLENRLDAIYRLKRKYGKTVEDIIRFCESIKIKREQLMNSDELQLKLNKEINLLTEQIKTICSRLTEIRKKGAEAIGNKIRDALVELGMKDARFTVDVQKKENFTADGADRVEFLISPNPGEELKPLTQIASGGEISRVMLALKTILADADSTETFVFDEIDAGVSGRTALRVAAKLSELSEKRQIICITHLPQIAAIADAHFLIEKKYGGGKTETGLKHLDHENIVKELARLIGGAKITETTLRAAEEMKRSAKSS